MSHPTTLFQLNQLYFYLVEGCNLACRHCWLAPRFDPLGTRSPQLPVEIFKLILQEAKPLGLSAVKLTGGEPLLHASITELLDIIEQEKLKLTLETNGLLCTPELAEKIASSTQPFVSVSLDGADSKMHESVRTVKGSFEGALAGVRNLVQAGVSPQIIFSVMRENSQQVQSIVRLAENIGASSVKFNIIQPTARGEVMHEHGNALEVSEYIEIGKYIEQELAASTNLDLFYDYPLAFRPLNRIASGEGGGTCGILGILGVLATGEYALCGIGEHIPEFVFGKAGVDQLEDVWNGHPVLNQLREGLPQRLEGICAECIMKARCLGSCIAQNRYSSGSLWAPFWFCAQADAEDLFPISRKNLSNNI